MTQLIVPSGPYRPRESAEFGFGQRHAQPATYPQVGERDPVIGRLMAVRPGLRPPLFHSPYEAAAWSVLSARRPARQMAVVRDRLTAEHGRVFDVAGEQVAAFPGPEVLLAVGSVPGSWAGSTVSAVPPPRADVEGLGAPWRPRRTWTAVLLRAAGPRLVSAQEAAVTA